MHYRLLVLLAFLFVPTAAQAEIEVLDNDEQRIVYTLGVMLMKDLAVFRLNDKDLEILQQGMRDAQDGELLLDPNLYEAKIQDLAMARLEATKKTQASEAADFVAAAKKKAGARTTKSGLVIRTTTPGKGPSPKSDSKVTAHYEGRLVDGTIFDASANRGQPLTFPLNHVIPCWSEAVQLMKVGEKAQLICPPDIAYGDKGAPPAIPPGATLVFDIHLLSFK